MELSTAWLEWLVLGTGHELMLFASVGILLIGLDDLLFDALWISTRGQRLPDPPDGPPLAGTLAIFVPAWDEARVLPAMLRRTLAAWDGEDFRLYVGCYPNDAATLFAISPLIARDRRLRLVVSDRDGPTTKGDNLNRIWAALGEDERAEAIRFAGIVLHDAEDHVHGDELALYRSLSERTCDGADSRRAGDRTRIVVDRRPLWRRVCRRASSAMRSTRSRRADWWRCPASSARWRCWRSTRRRPVPLRQPDRRL